MKITNGNITASAVAISKNIFRVRRFIGNTEPHKTSLCVSESIKPCDCENGKYSLCIDKNDLTVTVKSSTGKTVYKELKTEIESTQYKPLDRYIPDEAKNNYCEKAIEYKVYFSFDGDEHIYGLGCYDIPNFDLKNNTVDLLQYNTHLPLPFMLSSKNYGVFFDHYSYMRYNGKSKKPFMYVANCEMADYYIILGDNQDEVLSSYYTLIGNPGLLPKAVFGYIQSKERYETQDELVEIVERYRKINVPLDTVVQDWQYWKEGQWGEKSFDTDRFYDVKSAVQKIHDNGAKAIISVWPKMQGTSPNREEMLKNGQLLEGDFYNCFSEKGREIYYKQLKENLAVCDFDGYWTDDTEPAEAQMKFNTERHKNQFVRNQMNLFKEFTDPRFTNSYTYFHNKSLFEKMKNDYPDKRMFFLTRASFPGLSKYNTATWSGDISASWEGFENQIVSLLNHCVAGEPFCHNDIGGFFPYGNPWSNTKGRYPKYLRDNEYKELYTRWIQLGAFMPIMRSHGTACPREIWQFENTEFYKPIEKYINLRMSLLPYIYSTAYSVSNGQGRFINPLFTKFSEDENTYKIGNEYMFGDSILVCPVTKNMYYKHNISLNFKSKKAKVYLPKGASWYDFETDQKYDGGQQITVDAPIDKMPLFVKAGSIIPTCRGMQSSAEDLNEIHLKIYLGSDGRFVFYDDDGVSYNHEKGVYKKITISYNDQDNKLTFSDSDGTYKSNEPIKFIITVSGNGKETIVNYNGKKMDISLDL